MECLMRLFSLLLALATGDLAALDGADGDNRACTDPDG